MLAVRRFVDPVSLLAGRLLKERLGRLQALQKRIREVQSEWEDGTFGAKRGKEHLEDSE